MAAAPITNCTASMGPPPFGSGNVLSECLGHRTSDGRASMGPPPFGSGNRLNPPRGQDLDGRASMGPPPFGSGNIVLVSRRQPYLAVPKRFNGATAFRQWKHMLTSSLAFQMNELQWGHRLSAVETAHSESIVVLIASASSASMGPPPFGSGNLGNQRRPGGSGPMSCFNGATAFRQWKPCRLFLGSAAVG